MKTLIYAMFISAHLQLFFAGEAAASMTEQAKKMAQKDYQSATETIATVYKADMLECSKRHGPAAKACEIQIDGKREAAEEQAKLARDRAGAEPPVRDSERKKAEKHGLRVAKSSYGMDKAKIAEGDKQARVQCDKLKAMERNVCRKEVASRTAEANREAKASYDRSVEKAKQLSVL